MAKFLSDLYDALGETLTHMKSIKLNIYPGENNKYFWAAIWVGAEHIESVGSFKPDHLGYIIHTFEDTSDSRLRLWEI